MSKPPRTGEAEGDGAVLGGEELEDLSVGGAGVELGVQVGNLSGGVGAADVVAFEQDLAAAARAHELMTDVRKVGCWVAGAKHGEGDEDDEDELEGALIHGVLQVSRAPIRSGIQGSLHCAALRSR